MNKYLKNIGFIDCLAIVEDGAVVCQNAYIYGRSVIKKGAIIYPNSFVYDSIIEENCEVKSSYIEKSIVKKNSKIGPFAHIRPKSVIGEDCKIGNFVEVKNSTLAKRTKASHLSYIGDCDIGENCNIGCGVIFANFNGKTKNRSKVNDNCFIGSNCNIVAPVSIAKNSYICAGTTLTKNTKEDDFVIGRVREVFKNNLAHKYLKGS